MPGLRGHEHPSFGGWGGRYERTDDGEDTWRLADAAFGGGGDDPDWMDAPPPGTKGRSSAGSRTRRPTSPSACAGASVPGSRTPIITPRCSSRRASTNSSTPGNDVTLTARLGDPDGDDIRCRWTIDREASTCEGDAALGADEGPVTSVRIPAHARTGDTIHVIAEATDASPRPLKAWARVILTVR